ncbi:MAG: glutathione S-transferase N-terminal domain-containing protein [Candidatus Micrarchaeota archaeon]|nr:glutathione S-transferase N-terminal domain-containing protein [Candidatus Micrarchaeota archaeon]
MIDERTIASPKITVYSTSTCPYCVMAKRYLKEKGLEFEDVDISQDKSRAAEMFSKSGQMGIPVLDINGKIIVGFDRTAIENAVRGF